MISWLSPAAAARVARAPALAGVFICAWLLSGCASAQLAALSKNWPDGLPEQAQISSVPFFPQEEYQCGPAALAMVAQAAGVSVKPDDLVDQVYLPGRQGSLQADMMAASRRQGLPGHVISPRMADLLREVAAGHPVLVLQNLSLPMAPVWHYAVVIGYDRARDTVTLHSGLTEKLEMPLFTFDRTWARSGYWAMVALPAAQLPATAEPDGYSATLAALERVNATAARTAYQAALQRWPQHRTLLLGAGNTAYAAGDLAAASAAFEAATLAHPDFADAWNNLAQTRLDQGQHKQAATAIAKAVALGGPRLPRYLAFQQAINKKGF